jgi:Symplekin tight junction protein C terminal
MTQDTVSSSCVYHVMWSHGQCSSATSASDCTCALAQVWNNGAQWKGWLLAAEQAGPPAYPALLSLPPSVLTRALAAMRQGAALRPKVIVLHVGQTVYGADCAISPSLSGSVHGSSMSCCCGLGDIVEYSCLQFMPLHCTICIAMSVRLMAMPQPADTMDMRSITSTASSTGCHRQS